MEVLVTVLEVGAYSERQYQKQDGSSEYFKSRGMVIKRGGDVVYQQGMPYIVKGFWKHRTWGDNNDRHENCFYITDIQTL